MLLDTINDVGNKFGMKMNDEKTKTILVSKETNPTRINIQLDNENIEVKDFTYLCHVITMDGKYKELKLQRLHLTTCRQY